MAKQNKKDRRRRLKSLVLVLFLTIVLLSTSTYAWFTANRSVSIDPINVNIAASSGLQISTNASDWKTVVKNTDITGVTGYSTNVNQFPGTLAPVSTGGTTDSTTGFLNFYKGVVAGDDDNNGVMSLTATKSADEAQGTTGDFIAFDIFLKVDTASDIYLENGSGVKSTTGYTDKGLQYAARYAFVIEGNVASTAQASAAQALHAASAVYIVEPNYDAHTSTGVSNASTYYNQTTSAGTSGVAAVPYVGVIAPITTPIALVNTNPGGTTDATKFASISGLMRTNVAYSNADASNYEAYIGTAKSAHLLKVFSLSAGITKVRVYMWVEGQDVDCENSASGAYLTYKLGFTLDDDEGTSGSGSGSGSGEGGGSGSGGGE